MHRVLRVTELLANILDQVDSPAAIINFSLTSHAFSEIGLAAAWRRFGTEVSLAKSMPQESYKIEEYTGDGGDEDDEDEDNDIMVDYLVRPTHEYLRTL